MNKLSYLIAVAFIALCPITNAAPWTKKPKAAATPTPTPSDRKRVLVVPAAYKDSEVVVVGSDEYNELLNNKKVAEQLKKDYETLGKAKKTVDDTLKQEVENRDKMVVKINQLEKSNLRKTIVILVEGIIIAILGGILGLIVYMRFRANINSLVGLKLF